MTSNQVNARARTLPCMTLTTAEPDLRKRWRPPWCAFLLVVLSLLLAGGAFFQVFYCQYIVIWRLESDMAKSLPPQATEDQVDAWLKARGIPHQELRADDPYSGIAGFDPTLTLPPSSRDRLICGAIAQANPLLPSEQIVLEFYFDKDGKLTVARIRDEWEIVNS